MEIKDFVRQQRKLHKLTQRDLADRAGVGLRFIRELEGGKPTLRLDKVNVVLNLFGHKLRRIWRIIGGFDVAECENREFFILPGYS